MKRERLFIVENLDKVNFNSQGFFSMKVIILKGLKNSREEKKCKESALGVKMNIYEIKKTSQ